MDECLRVEGELGTRAADGAQPVHDEGPGRRLVHRLQMVADGDTLCELPEVRVADHVAQFGLADEHELHHLVLTGVDIGQHPQFFQAFLAEVLRFVENQDRSASGGVFGDHEILHRLKEVHIARVVIKAHAEGVHHPLDERPAPALGVGDQRDRRRAVEPQQKLAQQRGLAAADVAGQQRDRRPRDHTEFQNREGAAVFARPEQKVGVGQKGERALAEPEEGGVELLLFGYPAFGPPAFRCPLLGPP